MTSAQLQASQEAQLLRALDELMATNHASATTTW
jgi:hypothetical protein